MGSSKGAIIFDMDGTLCDSSRTITESINYVRSGLDLEPLSVERVVCYINDPAIELSKALYGTDEFKKENREVFIEHYTKNCTNGLVLYEGIRSLLEDLYSEFDMAVATNASDFFALSMLEYLDVKRFFKKIIGANIVKGDGKPSPVMIEAILSEFGCKADKSVLVGDSLKDQMAASNADIDFIHVKWGFGEYKEPFYAASNTKELFHILKNNVFLQRL